MLKLTKPPYADTKVDAEKTQQEITQLLRKYGVSQVNWQIDYDKEQVQLDFVIEYTKQEDQQQLLRKTQETGLDQMKRTDESIAQVIDLISKVSLQFYSSLNDLTAAIQQMRGV